MLQSENQHNMHVEVRGIVSCLLPLILLYVSNVPLMYLEICSCKVKISIIQASSKKFSDFT